MEKERSLTIYEEFVNFMGRNTRGAQLVSYGIASVGLIAALYRIRPFAKFKNPSNIPSHFIRERVPLRGTVSMIEPRHGTLLLVDHKPLLSLPRTTSDKYLPVKIAGVDASNFGVAWLQTLLVSKEIIFVPLSKEKEYVSCIVELRTKNQKNLKIGEELIKVGFGMKQQLRSDLLKCPDVLMYDQSLNKAQKWAEFKRNGYWQFAKRPTLRWKIQIFLSEYLKSVLPTFLTKKLNI